LAETIKLLLGDLLVRGKKPNAFWEHHSGLLPGTTIASDYTKWEDQGRLERFRF
jgi:hypothetical protein